MKESQIMNKALARLNVAEGDPLASSNGKLFIVLNRNDALFTVERVQQRGAPSCGLTICGLKQSELTFLGTN